MMTHFLYVLAGLCFGILREFGVVNYTRGVSNTNRNQGSLATLGVGILDLLVFAALALDRNIIFPVAYLVGETIGSYVCIGKK
jgi:hypothetical protein